MAKGQIGSTKLFLFGENATFGADFYSQTRMQMMRFFFTLFVVNVPFLVFARLFFHVASENHIHP